MGGWADGRAAELPDAENPMLLSAILIVSRALARAWSFLNFPPTDASREEMPNSRARTPCVHAAFMRRKRPLKSYVCSKGYLFVVFICVYIIYRVQVMDANMHLPICTQEIARFSLFGTLWTLAGLTVFFDLPFYN